MIYLTGIIKSNHKERKITKFMVLHIPFKSVKEINRIISRYNKRYVDSFKRMYADFSENKNFNKDNYK